MSYCTLEENVVGNCPLCEQELRALQAVARAAGRYVDTQAEASPSAFDALSRAVNYWRAVTDLTEDGSLYGGEP